MAQTELGYRRRNTLRYTGYDYTTPGAYFVTLCERYGRCVFGQVVDQTMVLNPLGQIAQEAIAGLAERHRNLLVDTAVIMPNHSHLLLWLQADPEQPQAIATHKERKFGDAVAGSLSVIMGAYKSSVTQQAQNQGLIPKGTLWQDNFYDHIVRGADELERIRSYIRANPARWLEDQLHPDAPPNQFNRAWARPR